MFIPVFVYGTLKSGMSNSYLLDNSLLVGPYQTDPEYTMVDLGHFPAVILSGSSSIKGEVYLVDQSVFEDLDSLEGYPTFYDRGLVNVYPTSSPEVSLSKSPSRAWMYFMMPNKLSNDDLESIIDSGIWL